MGATTMDLWKQIQTGKIPKEAFNKLQLEKIKEWNSKILGYTWHHNAQSAPHNMQLILSSIHKAVLHTGQGSLSKGR